MSLVKFLNAFSTAFPTTYTQLLKEAAGNIFYVMGDQSVHGESGFQEVLEETRSLPMLFGRLTQFFQFPIAYWLA